MKKVIFLVLVLKSFLFSEVNPATDRIVIENDSAGWCRNTAIPVNTFYIISATNFQYYYNRYEAGWNDCSNGGQEVGYKYYMKSGYYEKDYLCPSGQEIINGACAVPPTCPNGQIWNSDTDTCECPPPVDGYDTIAHGVSTEAQCNVVDASLLSLTDGEIQYITDVRWDSCRNQCLAKMAPCPCKTAIFNGACVEVIPPEGACPPGATAISKSTIGEAGPICGVWFKNPDTGFECYQAQTGCCLGDDGGDDGGGDSNSTNPDTNTTNPGDPGEDGGEDGEEDGGETGGGDSNTSTPAPGDSNTSTPAPGDSNTSTPGDSNTSTPYEEYEESDADKDGKESISGYLDEAVNTANKIKSDYERLMSAIQNGVAPVSISSGSAPQFCATVFGKQICINLCDSFGYFYSIFYYIFLILLTVMALRIYYIAFKMR